MTVVLKFASCEVDELALGCALGLPLDRIDRH